MSLQCFLAPVRKNMSSREHACLDPWAPASPAPSAGHTVLVWSEPQTEVGTLDPGQNTHSAKKESFFSYLGYIFFLKKTLPIDQYRWCGCGGSTGRARGHADALQGVGKPTDHSSLGGSELEYHSNDE